MVNYLLGRAREKEQKKDQCQLVRSIANAAAAAAEGIEKQKKKNAADQPFLLFLFLPFHDNDASSRELLSLSLFLQRRPMQSPLRYVLIMHYAHLSE